MNTDPGAGSVACVYCYLLVGRGRDGWDWVEAEGGGVRVVNHAGDRNARRSFKKSGVIERKKQEREKWWWGQRCGNRNS